MPRNHLPATSTLRNRNRITNKTRLKIVRGSVDAETAFIPDEDEEKLRLTNLVAGVDAEDANEHHLQEVLSAHRTVQVGTKPAKGEKPAEAPAAFIPIPENNGVVDNYDQLYQANRWTDPVSYICSSTTADEYIINGISDGFTYYMDERDQPWLEKNNEEARGEGTSAQGAVSGTPTRLVRSAKSKGKEPDLSQPVVITEDEFELVMGIFEYVTHEKTEYLHHSLETGMEFPAFSNYQSVFASPLPPSMFANFIVPSWIPLSTTLVRIAKVIYPYWRERRIERKGHRIIPALNGDESDTLNESYICFRRRESKAVRKTRASQASSSDKLARLQSELAVPLEIAKALLERERVKKDAAAQSQDIWQKRMALVDLKRKFPSLGDRMDEELLVDRERPVKKPEILRGLPLKIKPEVVIPPRVEISIRPKDRVAKINELVEARLARQREVDQHWEDGVDNSYQSPPTSYGSRLFKYIPPSGSPVWPSSPTSSSSGSSGSSSASERSDDDEVPVIRRAPRAVRLRYGRGGRLHLDRRETKLSALKKKYGSSLFGTGSEPTDADMGLSEDSDAQERIEERWKFDDDDTPAKGPLGSAEDQRVLLDDYTPSILATSMTLLNDRDVQMLSTDATLHFDTVNGRTHHLPYVLGSVPFRRDIRDTQGRLLPPLVVPPQPHLLGSPNFHSAPVSVPHSQHKKMSSLSSAPMRISSGGGMRTPSSTPLQPNGMGTHTSPPNPVSLPQVSPTASVNGISRAAISMPHVDIAKPEPSSTPSASSPKLPMPMDASEMATRGIPARPPSQNLNHPQPIPISTQVNGFHANPVPNISSAYLNQGQASLTYAQMQNLKSAFSGVPNANDMAALQSMNRHGGNFMHPGTMVNGNGIPMQLNPNALKMQNARMHWAMNNGMNVNGAMGIQRPPSIVNGHDGQLNGQMNGVNGMGSPNHMHAVPIRTPSANGMNGMRNGIHINGQHSMSPPHQLSMSPHLSPPPLANISQSQSPRLSMTPTLGITSPSLQHQQAINGSQNGF